MPKVKRVLFICYGNICRSPAAEVLADFYAEKIGLEGVNFDSAGWHKIFDTANQDTKDYMKSKDIDMLNFKSKLITRDLIEKADLIIGMERYHLSRVRKKFRDIKEELKDKLFTLKQFNGAERKDWNIPDPYQTGTENYNRIIGIIEENIEKLVKKIVDINNQDT
jgi:protein-tyrosine phosphatase